MRDLLKHKHIVIATMPLQLKQDQVVLEKKRKRELEELEKEAGFGQQ